MSWNTPRTWVAGSPLLASELNADIRDNLNFLYTPPAVRATRTSSQSIGNATWTALSLTSETYDTDTMHDNTTNPGRLTVKTAGRYLVIGNVRFASSTAGAVRALGIGTNGSASPTESAVHCPPLGSGNVTRVTHSALGGTRAVNDWFEILAFQDIGAGLNSEASEGGPFGAALWVGN